MTSNENKYYDIREDLHAYPDAWCYLVWSKRGPGKTYSTLRYLIENKIKFVFVKRIIEDIKMLCANGERKGVNFDVSPFVPLNRDFGWDIKPVPIIKGIAGFYHAPDGQPSGDPVGYCVALSASKDIKGFDMSDADVIVFDEFIPKKHERINRGEGEQLLDIYMTIRRDRILRGKQDLKLICLANATSVNNPTFITVDVVDEAVQMDVCRREYNYLKDRGILMHLIPADKYAVEEQKSGIETAMTGTEWADMAFGGHFAYDDFTAVKHQRLKGYQPLCCCTYKKKDIYIYVKDGFYYASKAQANVKYKYNLARENDQKRFWYEFVRDLQEETMNDRFTFETFTMYDLITNYRNIFDI